LQVAIQTPQVLNNKPQVVIQTLQVAIQTPQVVHNKPQDAIQTLQEHLTTQTYKVFETL
jgi:hypothetical protein